MAPPAWRTKYRIGAFKGVEFGVASIQTKGGRRVVLHKFPSRDKAFPEDLGAVNVGFQIEGYIVGEDYGLDRDRLIAALNSEGPGIIRHPYQGEFLAQVNGETRVIETESEGGMLRFSASFEEAGDKPAPSAGDDTASVVEITADETEEAIADEFVEDPEAGFDVLGFPGQVFDSAVGFVNDISDQMDAVVDFATGIVDEVDQIRKDIQELRDTVVKLVSAPALLAAKLQTTFGRLKNIFTNPPDLLSSYKTFFGTGDDRPREVGQTVAESQINRNTDALAGFMQRTAASEYARAMPGIDFDTLEDALTARDDFVAHVTKLLESAPDDMFGQLQELRAQVVRDLAARQADLARIITIELASDTPSLVVSYENYGTTEKEAEILARNRVRNPAFVPRGELEILTDVNA